MYIVAGMLGGASDQTRNSLPHWPHSLARLARVTSSSPPRDGAIGRIIATYTKECPLCILSRDQS